MAVGLTAEVKTTIRATNTNALDLRNVADTLGLNRTFTLTNGTGAGKGQVLFADTRSLATTTSENIDLAGALTGAFGTVTFSKIKFLRIEVVTATAGYRLEVGGAASNAFATPFGNANDLLVVQAGGGVTLEAPVDGYTVTAGTGDILKINNPSGGTVEYNIIVMGEGTT